MGEIKEDLANDALEGPQNEHTTRDRVGGRLRDGKSRLFLKVLKLPIRTKRVLWLRESMKGEEEGTKKLFRERSSEADCLMPPQEP